MNDEKEIDQEHCPLCGRKFEIVDIAVHWDARGPSYCYCACTHCKKAWEIGQLKYMSSKIERREVKYIDIDVKEFKERERELLRQHKKFIRAARKAFRLGLMNIRKNYMGDQRKYMLIHNKKHMRKLLREDIIDEEFIRDLGIKL